MDPEWVDHTVAVFKALADEKRLAAFYDIAERASADGPLSYTEAMEAAGFDDSGHFNYHLSKLTEDLLYELDDHYYPTIAGQEIRHLIRKGQLRDNDVPQRAATVGATCPECGQGLAATYSYKFIVGCPDCLIPVLPHPMSPDVGAAADLRAVAHELDRSSRDVDRLLLEHRCPDCGGEPTVEFLTETAYGDRRPSVDVFLRVTCPNCWRNYEPRTVGQVLLGHPTVREYCADHDIDLFERPQWEYEWTRTDLSTTIRSRDPWQVEKVMDVDGCRVVAVLEADGTVSHVDHVPVDPARLRNCSAKRVG